MNELIITGDIKEIIKECAHEQYHFTSVINYIKKNYSKFKLLNITLNEYVSVSLAYTDFTD